MRPVDRLDGIGEWVVLSFHDPEENAVELLKARGVRGGVT